MNVYVRLEVMSSYLCILATATHFLKWARFHCILMLSDLQSRSLMIKQFDVSLVGFWRVLMLVALYASQSAK